MAIVQTATNAFKQGMLSGVYNFNTGVFKIALYTGNANLTEDTAVYTSTEEVVATGYTAGGETLTVSVAPTTTSNIAYISFSNASWTAALTARAALIYLDDGLLKPTVCVLDFGADKSSTTTFTVQFPPATSSAAIIRIV
jgi:hypothetical protein